MGHLFTSESVSEGHPDKVCDRVSDTILDLFLAHEAEARVACETFATTNRVIVGGEVRRVATLRRHRHALLVDIAQRNLHAALVVRGADRGDERPVD